ncbi:MAG TPA: ATP-binding cassette domain-containing protein [Myxococcota bacterium]|nr:ATP-binding cassette domain-containing protein [Myxococcota bacterium]
MTEAIEVRGLRVDYPSSAGGAPIRVLDGIDFSVATGELVCIVGPSGCGKSTLLNVIGGFLRPSAGGVRVQGEPVRGPDRRRVFVFQESAVFPWRTVAENVGFGLSHLERAARARTVAHWVERVGLAGFERAYPRQLSGGMRQRVEIARALAANPDVLYLDEPFASLDYLTRLQMRADLLGIWRAERKTILLVTHDIDEALQLADRVLVLSPRPARVQEIVAIPLGRPRPLADPVSLAARAALFRGLGVSEETGSALPARAASPAPAPDADVVVVGGGPAGSILASYLAGEGIDHVVLDRAVHPRPHVGESLVCSTTRVFDEIGFLQQLEHGDFVRKRGALFTLDGGRRELALEFRAMPDLGIAQDHTYHVDRSRFDELLLAHAAARGARIRQGTGAEAIDLAGDLPRVTVAGGESLRARIVADASGRATLLGRQLRTRRNDPRLNQIAVHGWFRGVERGPDDSADWIHIHVFDLPRAWAWQIPISAEVTSVGIVCEGQAGLARDENGEAFFGRMIASHPLLASRLGKAQALSALSVEGSQSYFGERLAGRGWIALGDAAQFVDPVFSSGVSVAAESARFAAQAIRDALRDPGHALERFAEYDETVRRGGEVWRDLILLFYRKPPVFLSLLEDPATRPALQSLLQGRVFGPADATALAELELRALELERA